MAGSPWQDSPVLKALFSEPWTWDFFQALRTIDRAMGDTPGYSPIGTSRSLEEEAARFGQFLSLDFATSAVDEEQANGSAPTASRPPRLHVRFMGLTTPQGPLPLVMSEFVRNRALGLDDSGPPAGNGDSRSQPDPALAAFFDIFHHRLICLFYRAWALARKAVDFDHREDERSFAEWIGSTFGFGMPEFREADSIPYWEKLAFAGYLANASRPLSGLQALLRAAFDVPCEVEPFIGQWVNIPVDLRSRLGESPESGTLGESCVLGSRVWELNQKFSVRLGPMSYETYQHFVPLEGRPGTKTSLSQSAQRTQRTLRKLRDWIDLYTHRQYCWEVIIVLKREDVPGLRLGQSGELGRNAWLKSRAFTHDPDDYRIFGGFVSIDT